jgi:hypothetical protein
VNPRAPTNFGRYDDFGRPVKAARWPWRLRVALRTALLVAAVVLAGLFLFPTASHAGRSCEPARPTAQQVQQGLTLAERTAQALDASGARVVLLARAGQDLGKYGLRWSHVGIAYKTDAGPWRVAHKLNQCGTAVSGLYRQGLGEFFLDDPWRYEAAWSVPTPAVQAQLSALLGVAPVDGIGRLHTPAYSLVSYAWADRYQQSNQWVIETLALAMEPSTIADRGQAQAWLRLKGYTPTTLKLGPLTRLGGRMSKANVAFDDHPNDKRFSDRIETVTADSVFAWLQRSGLGAAPVTLGL